MSLRSLMLAAVMLVVGIGIGLYLRGDPPPQPDRVRTAAAAAPSGTATNGESRPEGETGTRTLSEARLGRLGGQDSSLDGAERALDTSLRAQGARMVGFSATFCFAAASLKASVATLDIYDREDGFEMIQRVGERLRSGLQSAATASGHRIRQSGPVTMPTLLFEEDPNLEKGRCFSGGAALRGSLLHPT
ncbi:MAG: hypothetical protein ABGX04_14390 [Myxococcales bacterium]|nr:hypothetical protein [Myxococcales bacterium]HIL81287.1 hypothetical protein [Myxococcales bacterium]